MWQNKPFIDFPFTPKLHDMWQIFWLKTSYKKVGISFVWNLCVLGLEIDPYCLYGANTDISAIHGPIAETDISKIYLVFCFIVKNNMLYSMPYLFSKTSKVGICELKNFLNCSNFNILLWFFINLINDDAFVLAATRASWFILFYHHGSSCRGSANCSHLVMFKALLLPNYISEQPQFFMDASNFAKYWKKKHYLHCDFQRSQTSKVDCF